MIVLSAPIITCMLLVQGSSHVTEEKNTENPQNVIIDALAPLSDTNTISLV